MNRWTISHWWLWKRCFSRYLGDRARSVRCQTCNLDWILLLQPPRTKVLSVPWQADCPRLQDNRWWLWLCEVVRPMSLVRWIPALDWNSVQKKWSSVSQIPYSASDVFCMSFPDSPVSFLLILHQFCYHWHCGTKGRNTHRPDRRYRTLSD